MRQQGRYANGREGTPQIELKGCRVTKTIRSGMRERSTNQRKADGERAKMYANILLATFTFHANHETSYKLHKFIEHKSVRHHTRSCHRGQRSCTSAVPSMVSLH